MIIKNFIVFEGIDGAGTSTQSKLLEKFYREQGTPVHYTCEPTQSTIGNLIRKELRTNHVSPRTLALLFAADRSHHLDDAEGGILRLCKDRKMLVLSDRYFFSSIAYQGADINEAFVQAINALFPLPEHLIFIDTPPEIALKRIQHRPERDRYEYINIQHTIRERYLSVLESYKDSETNILYFDGSLAPEEIHLSIRKKLSLPI